MLVLFVSSEVAPFAKVGGLGDVVGALPQALAAAGHEVRVVMPLYSRIDAKQLEAARYERGDGVIRVRMGSRTVRFALDRGWMPGKGGSDGGGSDRASSDRASSEKGGSDGRDEPRGVPIDFVRCGALYGRPGVYTQDPDEHLRFGLLNHAALVACQLGGWAPDVIVCNDWQTALIPLLLRSTYAWDRLFARTRTVLTIHNLGHQGTFGVGAVADVGLEPAAGDLHQAELEQGRFSFLLTGILYANAIATVSPTYAREILTDELGLGLGPFLRARRDAVFGVLNGIDTHIWDPETDPHLPAHYSADDLTGKAECKRALLQEAGLRYDPSVPLVGIVSRLVWQKGFDLCEPVLHDLLRRRPMQLVVLGTGEARFEGLFAHLAHVFGDRVSFFRRFSEPLAHRIEAGSDFFLMPSRYEPCGLNQMYSLRYGTAPIVHRTGGLADTVQLWDPANQTGNGFIFDHFEARALHWAMTYALDTFGDGGPDSRARMDALRRNGMRQELGLDRQARETERVLRFVKPGI